MFGHAKAIINRAIATRGKKAGCGAHIRRRNAGFGLCALR